MVVVKHYMHSKTVSQAFTAWPESSCKSLSRQPAGTHKRRPANDVDRSKLIRRAEELFKNRQINAKARDYLVEWSEGSRRRLPRPASYEFLNHRNAGSKFRLVARPDPDAGRVHHVRVQGIVGTLPEAEESEDDAEDGELVCL